MIVQAVDRVRLGGLGGWNPASLSEFISELIGLLPEVPVTLHPLGFVHFELTKALEIQNDERVRVHLWNPILSPPDKAGNVHDHTWHLKSGVLHGRLENKNFRPIEDASGPLSGSRVSYGTRNSFTEAGNYRLQLLDETVVSAGETYSIPSRIVHESTLLSAQALTLVISKPDELALELGPLLLSAGPASPLGTEHREVLTSPRAKQILSDLQRSAA